MFEKKIVPQSDIALDPLMDPETMSTWRHLTSYPSPDEVIEEYLGHTKEFSCLFLLLFFCFCFPFPRDLPSPCQMMIGVYNHLLSKVFRFLYHSQKVIGSLGFELVSYFYVNDEKNGRWTWSIMTKISIKPLRWSPTKKVGFMEESCKNTSLNLVKLNSSSPTMILT